MTKKIGILEICVLNHYVLINGWTKMLKAQGFFLIIFTTPKLYNLLNKQEGVEYVIKKKKESYFKFFKKVSLLSLRLDYLVITSLQSHLIPHYFFLPRTKTYLTIHNSHTWFVGNRLMGTDFFKNLVKRIIRNSWKRRAYGYIVNSTNMKEYILSHSKVEKKVYIMPFMIWEEKNYQVSKEKRPFTIVVPGMLSRYRKNYSRIFALLKEIPDLKIILLGKPNFAEGGEEILEQAKNYQQEGYQLEFFEKYISPDLYEKKIVNCNLLLTDLNTEFSRADYREIYGKTKDTGVSYLMSTYSKVGVLPASFQNREELKDSTLTYKHETDLVRIIKHLISNRDEIEVYNEAARRNSRKFSQEEVYKKLEGIFSA